jgi:hypothetical protein
MAVAASTLSAGWQASAKKTTLLAVLSVWTLAA